MRGNSRLKLSTKSTINLVLPHLLFILETLVCSFDLWQLDQTPHNMPIVVKKVQHICFGGDR
jgi:hypothetical protein